ncbi:GNAT family N-acetyltransferase [Terrabacter terrigena]|uniref:GNAT family N-acetyltransferase n=1 Tax=Terrabacter terrigena TaxID=574718 RepID=A0ABW3MSD7_9MICO
MRSTASEMSERGWQLRPLAPEHCDELGGVHMAVWRDAYAGIMPDDYLAGLSDERCADSWRAVAARPADAAARTLVVVDDRGHLAGCGGAGPSRDADPPTEWELYAVNLMPSARGTGVADRFPDELLGGRDATLWVVEGNARARAFYTRRGFVDEGGRGEHPDTGPRSCGWYDEGPFLSGRPERPSSGAAACRRSGIAGRRRAVEPAGNFAPPARFVPAMSGIAP